MVIDMIRKVFLDFECLPIAEDWEKCFLYGLHKSKILVPIVSAAGWENITLPFFFPFFYSLFYSFILTLLWMKQAGTQIDNVLKEYENMIDRVTTVRFFSNSLFIAY